MDVDKYIVAIELGTSKIVGAIGRKTAEGSLVILAIEKEDSAGCVKRGCISNVEEAASRVKKIIQKLENRTSRKIERVYVGVGGQSLRSVNHETSRQLAEDMQITAEMVSSLKRHAMNVPVNNAEVIEAIATDYLVDNRIEPNPVGVFCSEIVGRFELIAARPVLKKNLARCFTERLRLPIAGYEITPLVTANLLLSEDDKKLGCALIDFGASTTTLSIYKDDALRCLVTIPFGGRNITLDICDLNIMESEAERLKLSYGCAISSPENEKRGAQNIGFDGSDSAKIGFGTFCRVVEARIEEIVENILAQVEESGYGGKLSSGIIITGAASQLKSLPELLEQKSKMTVRKGTPKRLISYSNSIAGSLNPGLIPVIALLWAGQNECLKEEENIESIHKEEETFAVTGGSQQKIFEQPKRPENKFRKPEPPKPQKPKKPGLFEILRNKANTIFDEGDENLK